MELAIKDASGALEVSEATFGREFNEALVHQVVVAYGLKKVLAVHVLVQSVVQFGVQVALASQLNHKTTAKK